MKRGVPPTARNARTGELTPPGMTRWARAKRSSDWVMLGVHHKDRPPTKTTGRGVFSVYDIRGREGGSHGGARLTDDRAGALGGCSFRFLRAGSWGETRWRCTGRAPHSPPRL